MGEAIARFREVALAIRRKCDERHSQPRGIAVQPAAAKKFAEECRILLLEHDAAGSPYPKGYVRDLLWERDAAERHRDRSPGPDGQPALPDYIEWLPDTYEPTASEFREAFRAAVCEAVQWGSLFPVVEDRVKAVGAAAERLARYAAPRCHEDPNPEYLDEAEDGIVYPTGPTEAEADRDYIARHEEFAEAFDALAPFAEEPPKPATPGSEQQTGNGRGRGGRPQNDEALARELLEGWKAFEPEEGRKTKDRYLAQRPDVRMLKTEEARQRRIASLRVALDSALHLRREKTKQRLRARG